MTIALTSDHGNHSPEQWALATAQIIFDIDPSVAGGRMLQARALQNQIATILATEYYAKIIDHERFNLKNFVDHCDAGYGMHEVATLATFNIRAILKGTPWEHKANDPQWVEDVTRTIETHLETAIHVERLLFADQHPNNPSAIAYRARFHGAS